MTGQWGDPRSASRDGMAGLWCGITLSAQLVGRPHMFFLHGGAAPCCAGCGGASVAIAAPLRFRRAVWRALGRWNDFLSESVDVYAMWVGEATFVTSFERWSPAQFTVTIAV